MKQTIKISLIGTVLGMTLFASSSYATGYTVKAGDSLWEIASANATSISQLKTWNGLQSDVIYPGQTLNIPVLTTDYTTTSSDTMWVISNKFSVSLPSLIDANPQIKNPDNIWGGLTVHIPGQPATSAPANQQMSTRSVSIDGRFPLAAGSYDAFSDDFASARTWSPEGTTERSHEGVDIMAAQGTPIYSATSGKVIRYGWNTYGGWRITIQANDSTAIYYAHLSKYAENVTLGTEVSKGQLIGYVGHTGYGPEGTQGDFDPHLHFGMYNTDSSSWVAFDPYSYLRAWEQK